MAEVIRNMIAILETPLAFQPLREAPQIEERPDADAFGQVFDDGQVFEMPPDPNEGFVGVPPLSMRGVLDVATADSGLTTVRDVSSIAVALGQADTGPAKDGSEIPAPDIATDRPDTVTPKSPHALPDLATDDVAALSEADLDSLARQVAPSAAQVKEPAPAISQNPNDAAVNLAGLPGFTGPKLPVFSAALGKDMQVKARELEDQHDLSHGSPTGDTDTPIGSGMFRLIANGSPATHAWSGLANMLGARQGQTDSASDAMEQTGPAWDRSADMVVLAQSSFAGGRFGDVLMAPPGSNLPYQIAVPLLAVAAQSPGQPGQVEVILSPQELGPVRLEFRTVGDTLHVLLATERPETLDLMRRHGDALVAELRQAGYAGASLSFGHWGQSQRGSRPAPTPAFAIATVDNATDLPISMPSRPSTQSGELDLRF